MQSSSSVPHSAQSEVHAQLAGLVARHLASPFRKPYADYNREACDASLARYRERADGAPLILDSCCGVGESSIVVVKCAERKSQLVYYKIMFCKKT